MNRVAEDNVKNMKCSSMNSSSKPNKNKKAKDLPDKPSEEELCEKLANTIHINNTNCNLTNGTSAHEASDVNNQHHRHGTSDNAQKASSNNQESLSSNIHYDNGIDTKGSSSQLQHVRNLVEEALENLENSLQEKPKDDIEIVSYESEVQMPEIMRLIQKDLSEPYSIYTYRYFIHNWPKLCFLAMHQGKCIGAIVCKLDIHRIVVKRGYIAMLAVDEKYRRKKIGSMLVQKVIRAMANDNADEVVLETEITNKPGLRLYENLGFVRDKRLFRYYLNGVDALRLKLWLR